MAKLYNLARMTTATTGTGTITLGSAATSYLSFADAGVQNGETVTYAIVDGSNREVGRGVYTSSGTTLTRATILESTNANAAINLSGSAEVFITAAAEDIANVGETNTFTSSQVISVTDNSNAALRVTQLGTGNALLIEDSTNPDSSPLVVDASGTVIAGHTSNLDSTKVQVAGSSQASSTLSQFNYSALAIPASHRFYKSGTSTIGSHALVAADDGLGTIAFYGSDGTSFISGATISVNVDGTPGTNDMPGRIVFSTTGDGASLPSEKLRIGSAGQIGIIGGNYGTTGQVLTSGGSSAAPTWQTIANTQVSGLGSMATQNSNNVSITGGSITGITDLAIADGGTGQSTASAAANALDGYLEIVASAGTTTLTNTSARNIVVTGSTSHTIRMPDVTTLSLGWTFTITNLASSTVTLQSSGANNFVNPIAVSGSVRLVCIAVTGTGTASWSLQFTGANNRSGSGNLVFSSNAALTTPTIAQISGGSAASSTLTLQSTSGAGTTDAIILRTASQSERFRIDTSGALGIGGANYGTSGQVLTSGGSGAAPSWAAKGLTFLGTITTTSGSNLTLTGLNLTPYRLLFISINSVSSSSATDDLSFVDGAGNSILIMTDSANNTHVWNGIIMVALDSGGITVGGQSNTTTTYSAGTGDSGSGTAGAKTRFGRANISTASTSLGVSVQTGFDAGTVTVYGVA